MNPTVFLRVLQGPEGVVRLARLGEEFIQPPEAGATGEKGSCRGRGITGRHHWSVQNMEKKKKKNDGDCMSSVLGSTCKLSS